jgi:flagellin
MTLTVSNNSAVAFASHYLGKNQKALQMSIKKLASGKKIVAPGDDPGTLSVSMKLNTAVTRLVGASNNVQNAISFMEVQDGMLETAGRIVNRMAEMKGMATGDPMKSNQDIESYNNEFHDLQQQLFQISEQTFNGASIFARTRTRNGGIHDDAMFKGTDKQDHTIDIFTSDNGSSGTVVSINRSALLSALSIVTDADRDAMAFDGDIGNDAAAGSSGVTKTKHTGTNLTGAAIEAATDGSEFVSFAAASAADVWDLNAVSMGVFEKALENIAFLRAEAGGSMSRLNFAADSIAAYTANMRAAVGRIEDVDIALESSNLAKYSILSQASAAMIAQANSSNDVALMLLR